MSTYPVQPPSPARQAFDEAMHHLSQILEAHRKLDTSMQVLRSHLSALEQQAQSQPGSGA